MAIHRHNNPALAFYAETLKYKNNLNYIKAYSFNEYMKNKLKCPVNNITQH